MGPLWSDGTHGKRSGVFVARPGGGGRRGRSAVFGILGDGPGAEAEPGQPLGLTSASSPSSPMPPIEQILNHIGEPPRPPPITPARGPPAWDDALEPMPDWDLLGQPDPRSSSISASPGNRHPLPQRLPLTLISRLPAAPAISSRTPAEARSDTSGMSGPLSVAPCPALWPSLRLDARNWVSAARHSPEASSVSARLPVMCGRFIQHADPEIYASAFALDSLCESAPRYNVAPSQSVLAVRQDPAGRRALVRLRWGLVPAWSKGPDSRYSMINARAETVSTKPAYRTAFRQRRCLIPADGFYEWKAAGTRKLPFLIRRRDQAPFAMAGLWERWIAEDGTPLESCAIIVTDANAAVAPIHDRMPVIVAPDDYKAWLDPAYHDSAGLLALLRPSDADQWTVHPVSRRVNDPRHEGPELMAAEPAIAIEPVLAGDKRPASGRGTGRGTWS